MFISNFFGNDQIYQGFKYNKQLKYINDKTKSFDNIHTILKLLFWNIF